MFIAMLRVEMVLDAGWSRLLTFASWPNTNSPPVRGQLNGAADARPVEHTKAAASPIEVNFARNIAVSPGCCGVTERQGPDYREIVVVAPAASVRRGRARSLSRPGS